LVDGADDLLLVSISPAFGHLVTPDMDLVVVALSVGDKRADTNRPRRTLTVSAPSIAAWGTKCLEMIRVALTDAAYDSIASTLPKGAAWWPMQRDRGQCFIQGEAAVVGRMSAMRRPG
jgi:hypothetical protein